MNVLEQKTNQPQKFRVHLKSNSSEKINVQDDFAFSEKKLDFLENKYLKEGTGNKSRSRQPLQDDSLFPSQPARQSHLFGNSQNFKEEQAKFKILDNGNSKLIVPDVRK